MRRFFIVPLLFLFITSDVVAGKKEKLSQGKNISSYTADYDFRGVRLGMTVSEFRLLPYPKEAKPYDPPQTTPGLRQVVTTVATECTGDQNALSSLNNVDGREFGVVQCGWVVLRREYTESKSLSDIAVGELLARSYSFKFIALPGEAEPRLFQIQILTHARGFDDLAASLTEKFGRPTEVVKGAAQNRMGAVFDNNTLIWRNKTGEVSLYQLLDSVDTGLLLYQLNDHTQYYDVIMKNKKGKEGPKV